MGNCYKMGLPLPRKLVYQHITASSFERWYLLIQDCG